MEIIPKERNDGSPQTPTLTMKGQSSKEQTSKDLPLEVTVPMVPVNHNEKSEKFTGVNFKTRQQKMLFYLTTLYLARFLKEDPPTVREDRVDV